MGADIEVALIFGAFFEDRVEYFSEVEEITRYNEITGKPYKIPNRVYKVRFHETGEVVPQKKFEKDFAEVQREFPEKYLYNDNCFGFLATKQNPIYESPQDLGMEVDLEIEEAEKLFKENFPNWEGKLMLFVRFST